MGREFTHKGTPTREGWQRIYDHEMCGPASIVAGLREILESKGTRIVSWVVAEHHLVGDRAMCVFTIGLAEYRGVLVFRYVGEGDNPMGAGSHTMECAADFDGAVATLALRVGLESGRHHNSTVFRQASLPAGGQQALTLCS